MVSERGSEGRCSCVRRTATWRVGEILGDTAMLVRQGQVAFEVLTTGCVSSEITRVDQAFPNLVCDILPQVWATMSATSPSMGERHTSFNPNPKQHHHPEHGATRHRRKPNTTPHWTYGGRRPFPPRTRGRPSLHSFAWGQSCRLKIEDEVDDMGNRPQLWT
jgi:hypothetical protein